MIKTLKLRAVTSQIAEHETKKILEKWKEWKISINISFKINISATSSQAHNAIGITLKIYEITCKRASTTS